MTLAADILQSYHRPRAVVARLLRAEPREDRALFYLVTACALIFAGQWPRLARAATEMPDIPLEARLGGALLGWLFIAPLIFYALAGLMHLILRLLGGRGTWYAARLAIFWALLAAAPFWMIEGLVVGFLGEGLTVRLIGGAVLAATLWLAMRSLQAAEWPEHPIVPGPEVA